MSKKDIFTKIDIVENGKPAIFYGEISRKYDCFVGEETSKINSKAYERANKVNKGEILVNLEDFNYEDIGRCILYQNDTPAAINGNVAILTLKEKFKDAVNLRYISFYLNYKDFVRQYVYDRAVRIKYVNIERFKKNESKKENGYTRYKDDELNFEIIKFIDAINRERYTLNLESVSVNEEYFVDITNLKISIYSKKVFEEIKKMIDLINEKYRIPKRWRAEYKDKYFAILNSGKILEIIDYGDIDDNIRYNLGNYFKTKEEAEKVKEELDKFWAKVRAGEIGGDE